MFRKKTGKKINLKRSDFAWNVMHPDDWTEDQIAFLKAAYDEGICQGREKVTDGLYELLGLDDKIEKEVDGWWGTVSGRDD